MEHNRSTPRHDRGRLAIPRRGASEPEPTPFPHHVKPPVFSPRSKNATEEQSKSDSTSANEDDLDNVSLRDIMGAWTKQAIKGSPLEKGIKSGKQKAGKLRELKKDLKWALAADLDEPVKPHEKKETKPADAKSIDININFGSVPKLPVDKLRSLPKVAAGFIKRLSRKQYVIGAAVIIGALFIIIAVPLLSSHFGTHGSAQKISTQKISQGPDYTTVLPAGKTIKKLGGWTRVSPPASNPVYAYADKIGKIAIDVSEQPLPDSFKSDPAGKVADLAKGFAATDKVTAGSLTIYVGTNAKGPQSVILTKSNLLILIKSDDKISDKAWASYASSLN